jgi:hypothetical protein
MNSRFTLQDVHFNTELAKFLNFVGPNELIEALVRVDNKLASLEPSLRSLFDERYLIHRHLVEISNGPSPFRLTAGNKDAIRFASFVAGINRMTEHLPAQATSRLRSTILGLLRPDRDIRQLEHEVRSFVHFGQKGIDVTLIDLEARGNFDMVCESNDIAFDVECKTVTEDTGASITTDLFVNLCNDFARIVRYESRATESGVFICSFKRSPRDCQNLPQKLREKLLSPAASSDAADFDLAFEPRPHWTGLVNSAEAQARETIRRELGAISQQCFATSINGYFQVLAFRPHRPSTLAEKIVKTLKEAADQCSRERPSLIWLHLIGRPEAEFLELANSSRDGRGSGLNALAAKALHPEASSTDRSHVRTIRFSAEAADITRRPVLDAELLMRRADSVSGPCYDIPNPFCRFANELDP